MFPNPQDINPPVAIAYVTSGLFEQYSVVDPAAASMNDYKLHLNLTSSSYESQGAIIKNKLLEYLQSENNMVFLAFKGIILKEFTTQKARLDKKLEKDLNSIRKKAKVLTENIPPYIEGIHRILRFNDAEQFTLYLKPNVAIKDIIKFIADFESFLEQHNISAGQSPEFEWPLTRYFSLRKDRVNDEYLNINKPEYYAGFFKNPKADNFYMELTVQLNCKMKIFDDNICHLCLEGRNIHYDLLMLSAAQNAQTETEDTPSIYSQLFMVNALLSFSSQINNEARSRKRTSEEIAITTLQR